MYVRALLLLLKSKSYIIVEIYIDLNRTVHKPIELNSFSTTYTSKRRPIVALTSWLTIVYVLLRQTVYSC